MIGVITGGAEALMVGGKNHLADAGSVLRLRPGQAHSNATVGAETLRYSVLYIPTNVFAQYCGVPVGEALVFAGPVLRDAHLYEIIFHAHATLASAATGQFEQESAMNALVQASGVRSSDDAAINGYSSAVVEQARNYIDARFAENFGLGDLSRLTNVSPFHLVRVFKKAVGVSPLFYRNQRRLVTARRLLAEGHPTIQVALDLGYSDQSHFTRHFQRIVGVSPHCYAKDIARSGQPSERNY